MLTMMSNNILNCVVLLLLISLSQSSDKCVKFGTTFDVSLEGNNVKLDCSYTSINSGSIIPVCCAAINTTSMGILLLLLLIMTTNNYLQ